MPLERKKKVSPEGQRIMAYHEAGHVVTGWFEPLISTVKYVRVRYKRREGVTVFKTRYVFPCDWDDFLADITVDLGGIVAEKLLRDIWVNGASYDLSHARDQIDEMICDQGMNKTIGLARHLTGRRMSEKLLVRIEDETQKILDMCLARAERMLTKNRAGLDAVAKALIKRKKLKTKELKKLLGARPKAPKGKKRHAPKKKKSAW